MHHIVLAASQAPTAGQSSIVLYVVTVLASLAAAAAYVPKILGPIGKGIASYTASMRRAGQEVEDSRISDLDSQVTAARARVADLEKENGGLRALVRRIREATAAHVAWDYEALSVMLRSDPHYPRPPALHDEDVEGM